MAGSQAVRAGAAFVELTTKDASLKAGLDRATATLKKWGDGISMIGQTFAKIGAAAVAPLAATAKLFAHMGDEVAKSSTRTGVAVEQLSALGYAASQSGSDLEGLEGGLRKMSKTLVEASAGSDAALDSLAALGLTVGDLQGMKPDQQFKTIAEQISKIKDPTEKAARSMEIFGKTGTSLIPLMDGGRRGIEELEQAAQRLGLTMSTETAKQAEEFGDRLDDAGKVVKMAAFNIGAALAPVLREATLAITEGTAKVSAWIRAHMEVISTVGASVIKIAAWTAGVGAATFAVGKVVGALGTLSKVASLAVAHPMIAGFAALAVAGTALSVALARVADRTAHTSDVMATALQKADAQRELDQLRLQRLEQLAQKEARNSAEMKEAQEIISTLSSRYSDLGVSMDAATGKINGLSQAHEKMNAAMKGAALAQIDAELAERQNNIRKLDEELRATAGGNIGGIQANQNPFAPDRSKAMRDLQERVKVEQDYADALKKRRAAVAGGDKAALTAPQDEAAALRGKLGDPLSQEQVNAKKKAREAAKELGELEAQEAKKRGDRYEQEIREIRDTAAEKLKLIGQLLKETDNQGKMDVLRAKQTQTVADAEARVLAVQKQQTQEKQQATAELKKQLADLNGDRRESAKLEADAFRAREKARLDALKLSPDAAKQAQGLVEQIAKGIESQPLKDAQEFLDDLKRQSLEMSGDADALKKFDAERFRKQSAEKINSLGLTGDDLKRAKEFSDQIAAGMEHATKNTVSVQGTFNSAAIGALGGGSLAQQQLEVQRQIAKHTKDMANRKPGIPFV